MKLCLSVGGRVLDSRTTQAPGESRSDAAVYHIVRKSQMIFHTERT